VLQPKNAAEPKAMDVPSSDQNWTASRVLTFATNDFKKRGIEAARLEAELLLCHELRTSRMQLLLDAERPLTRDELGRYRALIERRRHGEPIAYILGKKEFYGREFLVDSRVLIPRPDSEVLIDVALRRTLPRSLHARVLDLGTGSGALALTLACERRTWQVTALDVSPGALDVARANSVELGAVWGVRLLESNLFEALSADERFELIVSNPPYIEAGALPELMKDVRDFEPHLALNGGLDGLDFYRQIVATAPRFLTSGGVLAVEIGDTQGQAVMDLFAKAGFSELELERDYGQRDRVVSGKAPSRRSPTAGEAPR
jgi:release factor glutamine methyltransferase